MTTTMIALIFIWTLCVAGIYSQGDSDDYSEFLSKHVTPSIDISDDFDEFEISEYEDPVTKSYHCTVKTASMNSSFTPDPGALKTLDDNGILSVPSKRHYYQVRQVRQRLCQFGFNPFRPDNTGGSIHKRFKNTLRLIVYNTPGIFPNLRVIRNDLDRRRKREPQIWIRYEMGDGPIVSEFDFDNYFFIVTGDFSKIQAFSKLLVALKLHKRLNNFDDPVSAKVNLDLGVAEVVLSSFGIWMMKDKSVAGTMVRALNGIRSETGDKGEVLLEFEESLKEAADEVDPFLYSYIWLLAMAEKYEIVRIKDKGARSSRSPEDDGLVAQ